MSKSRTYLVVDEEAPKGTEGRRLVNAVSEAQAARHATRTRFSVRVADQQALVSAVGAGVKVEDATADETDTAGA